MASRWPVAKHCQKWALCASLRQKKTRFATVFGDFFFHQPASPPQPRRWVLKPITDPSLNRRPDPRTNPIANPPNPNTNGSPAQRKRPFRAGESLVDAPPNHASTSTVTQRRFASKERLARPGPGDGKATSARHGGVVRSRRQAVMVCPWQGEDSLAGGKTRPSPVSRVETTQIMAHS